MNVITMTKKLEARLNLFDVLWNIYSKIGKTALEIMKLMEEKQYHKAFGLIQSILSLSDELEYQVKLLVTQSFKPIFDVKPEITQTFDEINEKKDKVIEWIERLRKTADELQKIIYAEGMSNTVKSKMKIHINSLRLSETCIDNSLMGFYSLSKAIFTEYSIWEMRKSRYKGGVEEIYRRLELHPRIRKVSETLFQNGAYRNAILDSFIEIEKMTREKSGVEKTGASLFADAFNPDRPILRLNSLRNRNEKDEQEGFMHIFRGASIGIRNPKAHDTFIQKDPYRTVEYLCLASLLAKRIDESQK